MMKMRKIFTVVALVVLVLSLVPALVIADGPVEIVSMRTEFSKTYDLGSNVRKLTTGGVVHWKYDYGNPDEPWKDVDLTWKGGVVDKAPYILSVKDNAITAVSRKTGDTITLALETVGAVDVSSVDVGSVKVNSGVVGVDVQVTPYADSIAFSRVLKDAAAVSEATYRVTQDGGGWVVSMTASDADGKQVPVQYTEDHGVITEWIDADDAKEARYPITVDPSITPYSSTSDKYIASLSSIYLTARNNAVGTLLGTTQLNVGQELGGGWYQVSRSVLFFDTSALGDEHLISAASLFLYGNVDQSATDFNLVVQDGQPTYPHDPPVTGDYYHAHYSGAGSSFSTAGFSTVAYNEIVLNAAGLDMITKEGTTKLCVRSDEDINASAPTGLEYVIVYSAEEAGVAKDPYLEVTYSVITPVITTVAATYVSCESARLNGYIVDDDGGTLDCRFQYDTDNDVSDGTATAWDSGYGTGDSFSEVVTGLNPSDDYWFRFQVRVGATIYSGATLSFSTPAAPTAPSDVRIYTEGDKVVLAWTRGVDTEGTEVRWKLGDYPTSTSDGTLLARTEISSATHTGCDYGTTYYYRLWGYSGAAYSATNATVMITTSSGADTSALDTPDTPGLWFTTVDPARMAAMPLYDQFNDFYDSLSVPRATGWLIGAILICLIAGLAVLVLTKKPAAAMVVVALSMLIMILLRMMPGWVLIFVALFFFGASKMSRPQEGGFE